MTCYSIALDESTNAVDIAQLAVFIRGVDTNLDVTEDLLALCSLKGTTTGKDIFDEVIQLVQTNDLDMFKITAVVTDGAPTMCGSTKGFTALLLKK